MSPPFTLQEVSPADYHALALLELEVFADDPLTVYAYGPDRASERNIAKRIQSFQSTPSDFVARMRKVVDPETGRIVACSQWKFYLEPWVVPVEEEEVEEEKGGGSGGGVVGKERVKEEESEEVRREREERERRWPPEGANVELCYKAFVGADKIREREFGGKRHVALNILITQKDYQRRGIGKMLLRDGLDEADRLNLPCWLGSSEPALHLYQSNGFVVDHVMDFDLRPYGGSTDEKHIVMLRPARGRKDV